MSETPKKPKPSKAVIQLRTEEILRIRLDSAEIWDTREYVREKEKEAGSPWELPPDGKPLSDSQLWRYIAAADKLIAESCRASRKKLLRLHMAQRRNVLAKSIAQGDMRTALAVLRDLAELQGLYPARKTQLTGKNGGPVVLHVTEEIVGQGTGAMDGIIEEVVTSHDDASSPRGKNDPPAPGPTSVPQI